MKTLTGKIYFSLVIPIVCGFISAAIISSFGLVIAAYAASLLWIVAGLVFKIIEE